jgi:hypothetical protein
MKDASFHDNIAGTYINSCNPAWICPEFDASASKDESAELSGARCCDDWLLFNEQSRMGLDTDVGNGGMLGINSQQPSLAGPWRPGPAGTMAVEGSRITTPPVVGNPLTREVLRMLVDLQASNQSMLVNLQKSNHVISSLTEKLAAMEGAAMNASPRFVFTTV